MSTLDAGESPPERGVFVNRTTNLRSVQAIGYDMDYTLLHYNVELWEQAAFTHACHRLDEFGWPVSDLEFDAEAFSLGLTFDLELGNLVKATRFGYVVRAQHGAKRLSFDEQRQAYAGTVVDLADDRFEFMNTLFELSRACLWTQLVDLFDAGRLRSVRSYAEVYRAVDSALNQAHIEGALKAEITANPDRFIDPDPEIVQTLMDQRTAGKRLLLITNSEWQYTQFMMAHAVDPYCGEGTWRDLFDMVIVSANKPRFFSGQNQLHRIVDEDLTLMQPHRGPLDPGSVYFGGNAKLVEETLGISSEQLLYVGDHLFGDVHVSKDALRWRTALIARELESEVRDAINFAPKEAELVQLMAEKVRVDRRQAQLRMARQRGDDASDLDAVTREAIKLDERVAPLARAAAEVGHKLWGPLMRAGNDKSLFARQVERYAD
ncbi:MAG: HAD-IG family 5'-nucleotidase, partial [Acidimicrobiales bacterium]